MGASAAVWFSLIAAAAEPVTAAAQSTAAPVEFALPRDRPLRSDERLALRVRPEAEAEAERVAVLIGNTDWSELFVRNDGWLEYGPGPVRLPVGRTPLVVYAVLPGNVWRELQATSLNVVTPLGFERAAVSPKVTVTNQGQAAETHAPDSNAPDRAHFQDVSSTIGFETEHVRGALSVLAHANVLAVSARPLALRFGERRETAPFVDLADFAVKLQSQGRELSFGQGSIAVDRYLMPALASRGFTLTEKRSRLDFVLGAASARSAVGFQQLLGVTDDNNRVAYARVGAELSQQPGAARVELAGVGGSRPAAAAFNSGQITDLDRSRGFSTRFSGGWLQGRLRLDTGAASTTSSLPPDPLLAQGLTLAPLADRRSHARHMEVGADVFRHVSQTGRMTSIATSYRYERVDPFFRSVGSVQGTRGDINEQATEATFAVGAISGQISRTWSHDNLAKVPTIMTTDSSLTAARAATPAGGWRPGKPRRWWPGLTYELTLSSQVGRALPPDSGFTSASQVPDQHNAQHTVRAEWQVQTLRFAYSLNRSLQDNRQEGRSAADFATQVHQASVGLTTVRLTGTVDVAREQSTAREFSDVTRTTRLAGSLTWRAALAHSVSGLANWTRGNGTTLGASSATSFETQYTYSRALGPAGNARPQLQIFARSAWQRNAAESIFNVDPISRRSWSLNTGVSFSFS